MKNYKTRNKLAALLCGGLLAFVVALAGCGNGAPSGTSGGSGSSDGAGYSLITEGKLTVAASLDFPPFENLENGKAVGFAIDLTELLCAEMGLECNYLPSVKYDTILPMITAGGKADVGVSSFTITEARKKEVDFTQPYCDSNQGIVVMKDSSYKKASDLAGKKIGAQSGTTGYDWAAENIKGADVVAYDEMTAVFAALQAGQIEAVAVDLPVAQYYVKNAYKDAYVIEEIPTGEQYGIAVSKDNPELTKALDKALATVKQNGKYDELYKKWFG